MGLSPVSDAQLQAYYEANQTGFIDHAGAWLADNWEYLAGGAMVLAGGLSGGVSGGYSYATGPGPHTITGFLAATAQGTVSGAAIGGAGGAAGELLDNVFNPRTLANTGEELVGRTVTSTNTGRLPQDIAVNPNAPDPLPTSRPIGLSDTQNAAAQCYVQRLEALEATDIRVNQQQIDIDGNRVGLNRPDVQFTLDGVRQYAEFDVPPSVRAQGHADRLLANDPAGVVHLFEVP